MAIKHVVKGIATYLPGLGRFACRKTGGTDSARYCYSVWLRHLVMIHQTGLDDSPKVVAELGPGDSIGTGLAALLTGAERYYAIDVVKYADVQANLDIFDELVSLFSERQPIPDRDEFPAITPHLPSCEFPRDILTEGRLGEMLDGSRVQKIRSAVMNQDNAGADGVEIRYFAPWYDKDVIRCKSVDMIFSQAVLEHVEDLTGTYEALYRWLKYGGFMSHQIDLSSHGLVKDWNGHWIYSDFVWKLIRGKRPWLINREPYSKHRDLIEMNGFEIVHELKETDTSGITGKRRPVGRDGISDDDFKTRTAYVLARKMHNRVC
ncbi:MAG: methyltransferase domain-containing protein [Planctomycetota bacterium]|nr:methyltransferase domain-containing protein [Planctomycetota bacterium]